MPQQELALPLTLGKIILVTSGIPLTEDEILALLRCILKRQLNVGFNFSSMFGQAAAAAIQAAKEEKGADNEEEDEEPPKEEIKQVVEDDAIHSVR